MPDLNINFLRDKYKNEPSVADRQKKFDIACRQPRLNKFIEILAGISPDNARKAHRLCIDLRYGVLEPIKRFLPEDPSKIYHPEFSDGLGVQLDDIIAGNVAKKLTPKLLNRKAFKNKPVMYRLQGQNLDPNMPELSANEELNKLGTTAIQGLNVPGNFNQVVQRIINLKNTSAPGWGDPRKPMEALSREIFLLGSDTELMQKVENRLRLGEADAGETVGKEHEAIIKLANRVFQDFINDIDTNPDVYNLIVIEAIRHFIETNWPALEAQQEQERQAQQQLRDIAEQLLREKEAEEQAQQQEQERVRDLTEQLLREKEAEEQAQQVDGEGSTNDRVNLDGPDAMDVTAMDVTDENVDSIQADGPVVTLNNSSTNPEVQQPQQEVVVGPEFVDLSDRKPDQPTTRIEGDYGVSHPEIIDTEVLTPTNPEVLPFSSFEENSQTFELPEDEQHQVKNFLDVTTRLTNLINSEEMNNLLGGDTPDETKGMIDILRQSLRLRTKVADGLYTKEGDEVRSTIDVSKTSDHEAEKLIHRQILGRRDWSLIAERLTTPENVAMTDPKVLRAQLLVLYNIFGDELKIGEAPKFGTASNEEIALALLEPQKSEASLMEFVDEYMVDYTNTFSPLFEAVGENDVKVDFGGLVDKLGLTSFAWYPQRMRAALYLKMIVKSSTYDAYYRIGSSDTNIKDVTINPREEATADQSPVCGLTFEGGEQKKVTMEDFLQNIFFSAKDTVTTNDKAVEPVGSDEQNNDGNLALVTNGQAESDTNREGSNEQPPNVLSSTNFQGPLNLERGTTTQIKIEAGDQVSCQANYEGELLELVYKNQGGVLLVKGADGNWNNAGNLHGKTDTKISDFFKYRGVAIEGTTLLITPDTADPRLSEFKLLKSSEAEQPEVETSPVSEAEIGRTTLAEMPEKMEVTRDKILQLTLQPGEKIIYNTRFTGEKGLFREVGFALRKTQSGYEVSHDYKTWEDVSTDSAGHKEFLELYGLDFSGDLLTITPESTSSSIGNPFLSKHLRVAYESIPDNVVAEIGDHYDFKIKEGEVVQFKYKYDGSEFDYRLKIVDGRVSYDLNGSFLKTKLGNSLLNGEFNLTCTDGTLTVIPRDYNIEISKSEDIPQSSPLEVPNSSAAGPDLQKAESTVTPIIETVVPITESQSQTLDIPMQSEYDLFMSQNPDANWQTDFVGPLKQIIPSILELIDDEIDPAINRLHDASPRDLPGQKSKIIDSIDSLQDKINNQFFQSLLAGSLLSDIVKEIVRLGTLIDLIEDIGARGVLADNIAEAEEYSKSLLETSENLSQYLEELNGFEPGVIISESPTLQITPDSADPELSEFELPKSSEAGQLEVETSPVSITESQSQTLDIPMQSEYDLFMSQNPDANWQTDFVGPLKQITPKIVQLIDEGIYGGIRRLNGMEVTYTSTRVRSITEVTFDLSRLIANTVFDSLPEDSRLSNIKSDFEKYKKLLNSALEGLVPSRAGSQVASEYSDVAIKHATKLRETSKKLQVYLQELNGFEPGVIISEIPTLVELPN